MADTKYDIRLEGRAWAQGEAFTRHAELPAKVEMIRGRLFLSEDDRMVVLAALLEHVGTEAAVRLGDPEAWKAAVRRLG